MRYTLILLATVACFESFSQNWSKVNNGLFRFGGAWVENMDVFQNKLYVYGAFDAAGTTAAKNIASWDGNKWNALGSGCDAPFGRLTHSSNFLYAAGSFMDAGGVPNTIHLAKWDGSQWYSVSAQYPNSTVIQDVIIYNNDFYIGGNYSQIGSLNVNRIASWNGSSWSDVSGGVTGGFIPQVWCMAMLNSKLYMAGDFTFAGGKPANYIASWNGTQWDSVIQGGVNGMNGSVIGMIADTLNNVLYISGTFTAAGTTPVNGGMAKWDGVNWTSFGDINYTGTVLCMYRNKLFCGRQSANASYKDTILTCWDGNSWQYIQGPNNTITSLNVYHDTLFVGGFFDSIYDSTQGLIRVNYIAKYWEPLSGVNELSQSIKFKVYPNPAKYNITIEAEEKQSFIVFITNPLGKKLSEKRFREKTEIDISAFGKGVFLVEVCDEKGVKCHTEKVVMK